jgi:hypothetical protein
MDVPSLWVEWEEHSIGASIADESNGQLPYEPLWKLKVGCLSLNMELTVSNYLERCVKRYFVWRDSGKLWKILGILCMYCSTYQARSHCCTGRHFIHAVNLYSMNEISVSVTLPVFHCPNWNPFVMCSYGLNFVCKTWKYLLILDVVQFSKYQWSVVNTRAEETSTSFIQICTHLSLGGQISGSWYLIVIFVSIFIHLPKTLYCVFHKMLLFIPLQTAEVLKHSIHDMNQSMYVFHMQQIQ